MSLQESACNRLSRDEQYLSELNEFEKLELLTKRVYSPVDQD